MSYIAEYIAATQRNFPSKNITVRTRMGKGGSIMHRVGINGDYGDIELSEFDMRMATRYANNKAGRRNPPPHTNKLGDIARFVN